MIIDSGLLFGPSCI